MSYEPVAFMLYERLDDKYEKGRLSTLRERLISEVRFRTGTEFHILQYRNDITWEQTWEQRVMGGLDELTFLIPVLTPSFFNSNHCRSSFERFISREEQLGRNDLILPIYYANYPPLNDISLHPSNGLIAQIFAHTFIDWRRLRFEPFDSQGVTDALAQLADAVHAVLARLPSNVIQLHSARGKLMLPTHIVDQSLRGTHTTICAAVQAAQAGDRILVRPGTYHEGIVVDKPLEVIGDGEPGDVIVVSKGESAVTVTAPEGRIVNLSLRQAACIDDRPAVDIQAGCLELENCEITSQSGPCVRVHMGAAPRLRYNRIHSGNVQGVLLDNGAGGLLDSNDIYANIAAGVELSGDGTPLLRHNRICKNHSYGVYIHSQGRGTLAENDIHSNVGTGVYITTESTPHLLRNRIHAGQSNGVVIDNNARGKLEENDIYASTYSEVAIAKGGNPHLLRNRIYASKQNGVLVIDGGLGILEENDIFANAFRGVEIAANGNPTLRRNTIHDNQQHGVYVYDNGLGTLDNNQIHVNAYSGVAVMTSGNPTLRRNQIYDNQHDGVYVYNRGRVLLEENTIHNNARAGIEVTSGSVVEAHRNFINRNGDEGISLYEGGGGTLVENDVRGNSEGAWYIAEDSRPLVQQHNNLEDEPPPEESPDPSPFSA